MTKPLWHEWNPWKDRVVYVPIDRLAECAAGGTIRLLDGRVVPYTASFILEQWAQTGRRLDAYILPQPDGRHSLGVRYGRGGSMYYSPYNQNPEKAQALLEEFRP